MDTNTFLFWNLCILCAAGLVMMLKRVKSGGLGWVILYATILLLNVVGNLGNWAALIHTAAAIWLLFVLLPGLLFRSFQRRYLAQRYGTARRLAQIIGWLHPADGWRQQPEIIRALELAQDGDLASGSAILERFKDQKTVIGISATLHFYRLTLQWDKMRVWEAENKPNLDRMPELLPALLRARGETEDINGLISLYSKYQFSIGKIKPPTTRDMCRLMLFAFTGQVTQLKGLFRGSLTKTPPAVQTFWLATAEHAAGDGEAARKHLESIPPVADPSLRLAIQRRLAQISEPPVRPNAQAEAVILAAMQEQHHDQQFAGQRTLFSKAALATQMLILLNAILFGVEIAFGGSESYEAVYRLGALYAPAVFAGQWWRLATALFLHFGWLHLTLNLFALCVLGPFVEFALGWRRFLCVYFFAGIGSMALVLAFTYRTHPDQISLGASGAIMGLIGATSALMIRGWVRERALSAKRKFVAMVLIVAMQTVFDALIPQISMTAHLSGVLLGFLAALACQDRLCAPDHKTGVVAPR